MQTSCQRINSWIWQGKNILPTQSLCRFISGHLTMYQHCKNEPKLGDSRDKNIKKTPHNPSSNFDCRFAGPSVTKWITNTTVMLYIYCFLHYCHWHVVFHGTNLALLEVVLIKNISLSEGSKHIVINGKTVIKIYYLPARWKCRSLWN